MTDGAVDVVGDEFRVDRDGDRGALARRSDDLGARVGGVAGRPDARHARAAVRVDPNEAVRPHLAAEGGGEPVGVRAQRGPDEEGGAREGATVGELETAHGRLVYPLTQQSSGMAVWKVVIPPERERKLRTHAGYEWLYVLSGEMRLIIGEHDITMRRGEVAEFDTRLPHWFGPAGEKPVEILSVHGSHGQRMHVRATPRAKPGTG